LGDGLVNLSVARDISDIKRAEEDQDLIHEVLRHDIMNKNTSIRGYLTLLECTELEEEQKEFLSKILRIASETESLILKIRHLVKTENDEISKVQIHTILDRAISSKNERMKEKGMTVTYNASQEAVYAGSLVMEIFANLIDNAILHANCKQLHLTVSDEGEMVKIIVEDDGEGISDEIKESLMEKGVKGAKSKGSGLGLYLVQKLVKRYGGEIEGLDSSLGGARFDIYLKKAE
jgi:signal transduction histidine kinase